MRNGHTPFVELLWDRINRFGGTSLVVQWLRLQTSKAAGVWVRSPVRKLASHTLSGMVKKKKIKSNVSINFPLDVYSKEMIKTFSRNIYALGKTVDYHTRQGKKTEHLT